MENDRKKVCIIGCGTYGSYLFKRFSEEYHQHVELTVIELGGAHNMSEEQAGLLSISPHYNASKSGRYFGLGGTSARWGGQVLFFDERDNPKNEPIWNRIIETNKKYTQEVIKQLFGDSKIFGLLEKYNTGIFKSGIWLKYSKRNLFKHLKKRDINQSALLKNNRVVDFVVQNGQIISLVCQDLSGVKQNIAADYFYLTAGAIESCRLLLDVAANGRFVPGKDLGRNVGDHLSVELFKIYKSAPIISNVNLIPDWYKGSLVTKRLIVQTKDGRVGYLHPIFNKNVRIFTILKQLLFGKKQTSTSFGEILNGLSFLLRFGLNIVIFRKMYVDPKEWSLQLDIEQGYPNEHTINLSEETDRFGVKGVKIDWGVKPEDKKFIEEVSQSMAALLKSENLNFESYQNHEFSNSKIEDVYHPVGFMRMGDDAAAVTDLEYRVTGLSNLFHFSTALFPSAKSINPTGAVFCLIEDHLTRTLYRNQLN